MIACNAIFYLLRDISMGVEAKRISIPNKEKLLNIRFVDDSAIFVNLEERNFEILMSKLKIFCKDFSAKLFKIKFVMLSWNNLPLEWFEKFEFQ